MKYETRKEHEDMPKAFHEAKETITPESLTIQGYCEPQEDRELLIIVDRLADGIDTLTRRLLADGSTETIICMKDGSEKNIADIRNESPQLRNLKKHNSLLGRVTSSNSNDF